MSLGYLYDPELLVPSEKASESLAFWSRLLDWIDDQRFVMGPATYEAFEKIGGDPPKVTGLPLADFWHIYGSFARRVLLHGADERDGIPDYTPHWGASTNVEVLECDIRSLEGHAAIFLATDAGCWPATRARYDSSGGVPLHLALGSHSPETDALRHCHRIKGMSTYAELQAAAADLYPKIKFSSMAWAAVKDLDGAERDNVVLLSKHLEVLNDHSVRIWRDHSVNSDRVAVLNSLGVEASPENGNTHKSSKAMEARRFAFENEDVLCEWHSKLMPHTGRIYFAIQGNKLHVGTIARHL
jgi:hypothetical protein